jgi:hypothetical protein
MVLVNGSGAAMNSQTMTWFGNHKLTSSPSTFQDLCIEWLGTVPPIPVQIQYPCLDGFVHLPFTGLAIVRKSK